MCSCFCLCVYVSVSVCVHVGVDGHVRFWCYCVSVCVSYCATNRGSDIGIVCVSVCCLWVLMCML